MKSRISSSDPAPRPPRRSLHLLPLVLLIPLPSIGGAAGMWWWPDSLLGKGVYALSKFGLLLFPLLWFRLVEKGRWSFPRIDRPGLREGVISGLVFCLVIWTGYFLAVNRGFDPAETRRALVAAGLSAPWMYLIMGVYWCSVNALLEEMVWRWFVLRHCRALCPGPRTAVLLAAAAFTLHHFVVVRAWLPLSATLGVCAAIFAAGAVWGWLTLRHDSLFPACVSHILADIGVFTAGAHLLFVQ
jgi:membrane protease YdiL (CAAX protease family)